MALTFNQTPANFSVRFVVGDDVKIPLQICHTVMANNSTSTVPVNITGYQFETAIVTSSRTFTGDVGVVSASNGTITANYSDQITSLIPKGCWSWYLKMTDTDSYTRTILQGNVEACGNGQS